MNTTPEIRDVPIHSWICNCDKSVARLRTNADLVHLAYDERCQDCLKTYYEWMKGFHDE